MKLIERKGFMYLENSFKKDIEDMNRLYGIGGDE